MSKSNIALLALSAVWIKLIWLLHPHADMDFNETPVYSMFPIRPEIMISKPTYIATACGHITWLIFSTVCYFTLDNYRKIFGVLFIIQFLQFVEYFFTYNEPFDWQKVQLFGHKVELTFTLAKLVIPSCIYVFQEIWRDR